MGGDDMLRQSVMSDISDMSFEEARMGLADACLSTQEEMDMGLTTPIPLSGMPQEYQQPKPAIGDTTDAKLQGRWGGRQARKNSLFSLSMASSISLLSIGSTTSLFS